MVNDPHISRPRTLKEVAERSQSLEDFGFNLRDWQHEIQRAQIHSRKEFAATVASAPDLLAKRFDQGDVADAYLAAYAEWLCDRAEIPRPAWCGERSRCADLPWFASADHAALLARTPASFRQRNIFTIPDAIFTLRRGRPRVSEDQKRRKAILRQRAYRARIRELVAEARQARNRT